MRADTGGRPLLLPCPQCPTRWSTEQTLAGHLIDAHEMDPPAAVQRALETSAQMRRGRAIKAGQQRVQEETALMANKQAPTRCNFCKSPEHVFAACAKAKEYYARKKRQPVTRKSPQAIENGNLVAHIRRLREDVERGEAAGRELAEVRKLLEARGQ